MALALYRKYRPRSFAEVIGQEHVTDPLQQALRTGRLNHAYLFSGPRGCGKTSSARILARSLNCAEGPTPEPCDSCDSCRALAPDGPGSIDVIEIDAASHGGVDDARDLRERAFFAPAGSKYKIYIIDEAHMVSPAGFNALLKLVEEPPDYVKFVFATTEPEKVLGTIKSRTHHYPFRLIPPGVLRPYLEQLATLEGVAVDAQVFGLVVRAGAGSARDSLSVLDQLIAGSGPEGVTYERAIALLGVTDVALIDDMVDALAAGDGAAAFAAIDRVAEAGHDSRRFAADLLQRFRDLIILRQLPDAAQQGLLDAPEDELTRMQAQAGQLGEASLSRFADLVHEGLVEMRGAASPRLLLELITARMLLPAADDSTAALLHRLERLERGLPSTAVPTAPTAPVQPTRAQHATVAKAPAPARPAPPTPVSAAPVPAADTINASGAPSDSLQSIRRSWDEIVRMVAQGSKKAAAFAREAVVREVDGNVVVLLFKHKIHADGVRNEPGPLLGAIHQVIGDDWELRCEISGAAATPAARPASAPPVAVARSSPAPAAPGDAGEPGWPTTVQAGGAEPPPDEPSITDDVIEDNGATSEDHAVSALSKSFHVEKLT